ncbi:MAG TPA: hypothetical protein PK358_06380 [Spirochaetota bacterium]|nr:hypothetical protein [Spirochaetota bacterium]HPJ34442.1 hypothetical protein [Spirochaetota bacterium]
MQPDLNNLKEKIQANRDFIDKITVQIPFFKGYVEKAENYDADRMVREFIADKILSAKKGFIVMSGDLVKSGEIPVIQEIDSIQNLLEGLLKKVQYADYGVSGGFSKIKITEDDQNRLLEYDWRLISAFDEINTMTGQVQSMQGDALAAELKNIKQKIRDFEKNIDERKYVIMEVI